MTRPEIWVSVTCTDRTTSLRALAGDLLAQAREAGLTLVLLVHDNSVRPTEERAISDLADLDFCRWLTVEKGVAAIPLSPIYRAPPKDLRLARLCFAKTDATMQLAAQRLCAI